MHIWGSPVGARQISTAGKPPTAPGRACGGMHRSCTIMHWSRVAAMLLLAALHLLQQATGMRGAAASRLQAALQLFMCVRPVSGGDGRTPAVVLCGPPPWSLPRACRITSYRSLAHPSRMLTAPEQGPPPLPPQTPRTDAGTARTEKGWQLAGLLPHAAAFTAQAVASSPHHLLTWLPSGALRL